LANTQSDNIKAAILFLNHIKDIEKMKKIKKIYI